MRGRACFALLCHARVRLRCIVCCHGTYFGIMASASIASLPARVCQVKRVDMYGKYIAITEWSACVFVSKRGLGSDHAAAIAALPRTSQLHVGPGLQRCTVFLPSNQGMLMAASPQILSTCKTTRPMLPAVNAVPIMAAHLPLLIPLGQASRAAGIPCKVSISLSTIRLHRLAIPGPPALQRHAVRQLRLVGRPHVCRSCECSQERLVCLHSD